MKKLSILGLALAASVVGSQVLAAPIGGVGPSPTANGTARGSLRPPITIAHTAGAALDFGNVLYDPTVAGTLRVPSDGAAAIADGTGVFSTTGEAVDTFDVTGIGDKAYLISVPSVAIDCVAATGTCLAGTDTINVDFEISTAGTGTLITPLSNAAGCDAAGAGACQAVIDAVNSTDTISVGGTLNVALGQPDGDYTGTYVVTVQYQ